VYVIEVIEDEEEEGKREKTTYVPYGGNDKKKTT
jgi:hypothetical protein